VSTFCPRKCRSGNVPATVLLEVDWREEFPLKSDLAEHDSVKPGLYRRSDRLSGDNSGQRLVEPFKNAQACQKDVFKRRAFKEIV